MTYIAHHGILGQKWGVRRFQNPDGTLTLAGKKRYYQVMTDPNTGEQIKSRQFTPEQLARAKEHGYTVEDVEERDDKAIEEARAHRKRMVAIGAAVVGTVIAALLIKKGIDNSKARKAAIAESEKQLDELRDKAKDAYQKFGDKAIDLVNTRVPNAASKKTSYVTKPSMFANARAERARKQLNKRNVQKELAAIAAKHKPAQEAAKKASDAEWAKYISNLKAELKSTSDANTKIASNASSLAKAASYTSELIKKLDGK